MALRPVGGTSQELGWNLVQYSPVNVATS